MKKCLIVVDYQVDFVNGTLGFEKAGELDEIISQKIVEYRKNGDEVVFTFDTHTSNYANTYEGRNLPIAHCIENTEGHHLYGRVADLCEDCDKCFNKPTFGSAELFEYLRQNEYESIELCGVVTNICVISNAVLAKTAQPEIDIIVDSKAVASNDDSLNEKALEVMQSFQIVVK
ncbi:MAG: cysteine hydrolase [Ruminococcus sp.]|nr:cysteine hydrolase [Ruminococcus sp.]